MALNSKSSAAEGAGRVLSFTREIDLPLGDQAMPEVATFTLFPLEAFINSALAIQQLQYLGNSVYRQFPPLLIGAGRTAPAGLNEFFGMKLEIGNSFPPSELDDLGQNLQIAPA